MSTTRRLLSGLTRVSFSGWTLKHKDTLRVNGVRCVALSAHRRATSETPKDEKANSEPIKFSTSKASHRTWKVERSMGSHQQRPWWKVVPISLVAIAFLLWCVLRGETDVDRKLEKQLSDHLPAGFLPDNEDDKNKPN